MSEWIVGEVLFGFQKAGSNFRACQLCCKVSLREFKMFEDIPSLFACRRMLHRTMLLESGSPNFTRGR